MPTERVFRFVHPQNVAFPCCRTHKAEQPSAAGTDVRILFGTIADVPSAKEKRVRTESGTHCHNLSTDDTRNSCCSIPSESDEI